MKTVHVTLPITQERRISIFCFLSPLKFVFEKKERLFYLLFQARSIYFASSSGFESCLRVYLPFEVCFSLD